MTIYLGDMSQNSQPSYFNKNNLYCDILHNANKITLFCNAIQSI